MKTEKQLIYKDDVIELAWLGPECEVVTLSDIEDMKPVNAVEVVRCKNCKYKESFHINRFGILNCELTKDDDYCSFGERKTDV